MLLVLSLPLKADTYTDADGIQWTYYLTSSGSTYYIYISGMSGVSDTITVPDTLTYNGTKYPVKELRSGFQNKTGIYKVNLPEPITKVNDNAFQNCTDLEVVDWKAHAQVPNYCFYECSKLKDIVLNTYVNTIGESSFYNCTSLWKVNLSDSTTTINRQAFYNCRELELNIPAAVRTIGENAFYDCSYVHIRSGRPATLTSGNLLGNRALVLVPDTALETYQNAPYWSLFRDKILAEGTVRDFSVTVVAQQDKSALHIKVGETNLLSVERLTVSGTINSYDIMTIRNKMRNLKYLDLSDARVVANKYEYYTGYCSHDDSLVNYSFSELNLINVKLPKNLKYICHAFENCQQLDTVEIQSGIETIGEYAFANSSLKYVNIPITTTHIGEGAFWNTQLTTITIPASVSQIDQYAFLYSKGNFNTLMCVGSRPKTDFYIGSTYVSSYYMQGGYLKNIVFLSNSKLISLPSYFMAGQSNFEQLILPDHLQTIGKYAFINCTSIDTVDFPATLKTIEKNAFQSNISLKKVILPPYLETIKGEAFIGCDNLNEIRISSSVRLIEDKAFYGCCEVSKVYTYTVEPTSISQNTFSCWTVADLYVPRTSFYNYYYNTQWSQFVKLIEFDEDYEFFYLSGDYTIGGEHGIITGEPDVKLNPGSGLIITGDSILGFGTIEITEDGNGGASILSDGNVTADTLILSMLEKKGQWHFLTFPYDIDRADVHCSSEFVIREYDGRTRAQFGSGGWKNVPVGELMVNGKGYIFQSKEDDTLRLVKANPVFLDKDFTYPLHLYPATNPWDANWNMIGNPYITYYDLDSLGNCGFDYPIIVWNGTGYDTYRPGDDTYHFVPLQGFFVQNANLNQITFSASGRETRVQANEKRNRHYNLPARHSLASQQERKLINITLGNNEYTDRTRIVINSAASVNYEIGIDVVKFMSNDAPVQLYSIGSQNEQYSINERPDDHSSIALGYYAKEAGFYTLSATRMDTLIQVYDSQLHVNVDLSAGDYQFYSEAGYNDTRFAVRIEDKKDTPTALEDLNMDMYVDVAVYSVLGQCIMEHANLNEVTLSAGIYVIKSETSVTKIIVK